VMRSWKIPIETAQGFGCADSSGASESSRLWWRRWPRTSTSRSFASRSAGWIRKKVAGGRWNFSTWQAHASLRAGGAACGAEVVRCQAGRLTYISAFFSRQFRFFSFSDSRNGAWGKGFVEIPKVIS
jgi:hypothetical protein